MKKILHIIDGTTNVGAISSVKRILCNYNYKDSKLILGTYGKKIDFNPGNNNEITYLNLKLPRALSKFKLTLANCLKAPILFFYYVRDIIWLTRFCKSNNISIVHLHHFVDITQFCIISIFGIKSVAHIRAIVNKGLFHGIPYKIFNWVIYRFASKIIGISTASLSALKGTVKTKECIIYNGLEGLPATPDSCISSKVDGYFCVASVIKFARLKGIFLFFDIIEQFFKMHPNAMVKFLLVAEAPTDDTRILRTKLFSRLKQKNLEDKLVYFEHFPDYTYIMPYIDILLHTTIGREGFGNVVLEAQWFGIPVVSTPCLGVNDIIEDGHSGFLLSSNDATEAINRIFQLYSDKELYNKLSKKGLEIAHQKKFSISKNIDLLHEVYMQL